MSYIIILYWLYKCTMALSLKNVFEYAKCNTSSRNAIEGEQILNSKQIVLCGKLIRVSKFLIINYYD